MSRRNELDAIVVGAGAIGGAMALAFARDGFEVALVEACEPNAWHVEDEVDLRVVALAPDARELLEGLGVWTSISHNRIGPYRHMRVWDALAPGELAFDAVERGEAALGWIVENRLIRHVLWQAISAEPRVRVLCPAHVADIDNASDAVTVTLDDGTRLRAKLLVAAEGADSSVRAKLGIAFEGRDYGQRAVVAHVATERPHEGTAWQRFQPSGPLAFLPLADGRSSIVWTLPDDEAARVVALADDAFRAELGCAFDFRLGAITSTTLRASFPLRQRLASNYVVGRCVLAGDSAHTVHPLAGQGMNLGLRDVDCLRRMFRESRARGSDPGAAHVLRRYERERRSENALAARALDGIERIFHGDQAWLRGALGVANAFPPLRRMLGSIAAGSVRRADAR
jgi:2-octaprenyl-3-methyl-6-methoxy-1,4-benzoquinol hydroxylase/2-octaprenylphenol hydroxylase